MSYSLRLLGPVILIWSAALFGHTAKGQTSVSGIIADDAVWDSSGSPYRLDGDVQVAYGATLSIEAGATVEGSENKLQIWGRLVVSGEAESPVSLEDVEVLPGTNSEAEPFVFDIQYAHFTRGKFYPPTGLAVYGSFSVRDSRFVDVDEYWYAWYPVATSYVQRNVFLRSGGISAGIRDDVQVIIENNLFQDAAPVVDAVIEAWATYNSSQVVARYNSFYTSGYAVGVRSTPADLDARENFWNAELDDVPSLILDRNDDLARASTIAYEPILPTPHQDTPARISQVLYVDDSATGANDGTNWDAAFVLLQDALSAALEGDEVWVAEGVYFPDQGGGKALGSRESSFRPSADVAVVGGFTGTETQRSERAGSRGDTILSGDIGIVGFEGDNSLHVVYLGEDGATIDGFRITGGNANGISSEDKRGGGLYASASGLTVARLSVDNNRSLVSGGGVYVALESPAFSDLLVHSNSSGRGGGMAFANVSASVASGLTVTNNSAEFGSGVYITHSQMAFSGNVSNNERDGISTVEGTPTILSSVITSNGHEGIQVSGGSVKVINSLVAHSGSYDLATNGAVEVYSSTLSASETVVWVTQGGSVQFWNSLLIADPQSELLFAAEPSLSLIGSSVSSSPTGLFDAGGNTVDPEGCGISAASYLPRKGTVCIDAGDNHKIPTDEYDWDADGDSTEAIPFDLAGRARVVDNGRGAVDAGAYEAKLFEVVAVNDSLTLLEDHSGIVDIQINDSPSSPRPDAQITLFPSSGTANIILGNLAYFPNPDYFGPDSLRYFLDDGDGDIDSAMVYIEVLPVNDPPPSPASLLPATNADIVIEGDPSTPFEVSWDAVTDIEGDPVTYSWHLADGAFTDTLLFVGPIDTTAFSTTYGEMAALLTSRGIDLDELKVLVHRVSASDPDTTVHAEAHTILFTRGSITNSETDEIPDQFAIQSAYPNPTSGLVTMAVAVPEPVKLRITVHDLLGRQVFTASRTAEPGVHRLPIDLSRLSPGVYRYSVSAGERREGGSLVLIK